MPEWYDALPDRDRSLSRRWPTDEFRDELREWCERFLGPVTSMTQHKLRGWATVWRVETSDGVWFAKQNCPGQQLEVPLMATLARLVPDRVVPVTAAGDGFLLTPDQGPTLHESPGDDLATWVRLAREAAELSTPCCRPATRAGSTTRSPPTCAPTCPSYAAGPSRWPRSGCRSRSTTTTCTRTTSSTWTAG
jgi:hypothetical protein